MAILGSVMVLIVNFAAVWALARHSSSGMAAELSRNPLVIATLAGFAYNASGLPMPAVAHDTLSLLAQAALPLGLIAVGASITVLVAGKARGLTLYVTALKLLAVPLAA